MPNEWPLQPLALGEAVAEEFGDERFVVGQRDEAVADVAGRQNAEFFLEPADEPPSSLTVTMAVRLLVRRLRPRSSVDRPVPPPIATIL